MISVVTAISRGDDSWIRSIFSRYLFDRVAATFHRLQDPVAARLHRQMDPVAEIFVFLDRVDDIGVKIARKRRRKLDPLDSVAATARKSLEKGDFPAKPSSPASVVGPIAIHILADEVDLLYALALEASQLVGQFRRRQASFPAPRKRHDAVCAEFVAALDDRQQMRHTANGAVRLGDGPIVIDLSFAEIDDISHRLSGTLCDRVRRHVRPLLFRGRNRHRRIFLKSVSPSSWATQPITPTIGLPCRIVAYRDRHECNNFCSAFSRTEQVLSITTSAADSSLVISNPSESSVVATRSESETFI